MPDHRLMRFAGSWLFAIFAITVAVAVVYHEVSGFGYLNFDDSVYLTENPWMKRGLTLESIQWALSTTRGNFWGPVTWMSFLLEAALAGMDARVSHLINIALHLGNTLLLYALLRISTRDVLPALLVALLFAVHPVHVESVAWVTERKDALSSFIGLLALLAWQQYVRRQTMARYLLSWLLSVLAMATKPSMVVLPLMLVLIEYWPLKRKPPAWRRRWAELLPFLAVSAATAVITVQAQSGEILAKESQVSSKLVQLAAVVNDYGFYLGKLFWPRVLAVFYPRPETPGVLLPFVIGSGLVGLTGLAFRFRQTQPWCWMGWLWFLLVLLPMSGLVTFGRNVAADRFIYLPSVGIFIVVVWGCNHLMQRQALRQAGMGIGMVVVVACAVLAKRQTAYWKDDLSLFTHAAAVTERNYLAYNNLGHCYMETNQVDRALEMSRLANNYYPDHFEILNSLGVAYNLTGDTGKAETYFRRDIAVAPRYAKAYVNLGVLLTRQQRFDEAIPLYRRALELDPENEKALNNLAAVYLLLKQPDKSLPLLHYAAMLTPGNASVHYNLGYVYYLQGKRGEALAALARAEALSPDNPSLAQLRALAEALPH